MTTINIKILLPTNKLCPKFVVCEHCGVVGRSYRARKFLRIARVHALKHGAVGSARMTMTDYTDLPVRPQVQDFL